MAKTNFYSTEEAKAVAFDILVENKELRDSLEAEKSSSMTWFNRCQKAEQKVEELTAEVERLKGGSGDEQ